MNRNVISYILLSFLSILFTGCIDKSYNYPTEMPDDFNFIAKINSDEYTIDTYNNRLTKTLDWDKDTVITYELTDLEKERIYKIFVKIDIYNYPKEFAPTSRGRILPSFEFHMKTTFNSNTKEIIWVENTESKIRKARKLRKVFNEIFKNILEDERIRMLPEDERAFL